MYVYLEENRNAYHKGQLTPFFIAVLTILIIAIMVTVNIGKISQIKTHNSNSADAGALAAASVCAMAFDALASNAEQMYFSYIYYLNFVEEIIDNAEDNLENARNYGLAAEVSALLGAMLSCIPFGVGYLLHIGLVLAAVALFILSGYYFQLHWTLMSEAESAIESMQENQWEWYEALQESMTEALVNTTAGDDSMSAIEAGRMYALNNGGVYSMMSEDQQDAFKDVIDNSGSAYTWQDGDDRDHSISADVSVEDISAWDMYTTVDDLPTIQDYFYEYDIYCLAISAMLLWASDELEQEVVDAKDEEVCDGWHVEVYGYCVIPVLCFAYQAYVWWAVALAMAVITEWVFLPPIMEDIRDGIQENGVVTDPLDGSGILEDEILVTIDDVTHSRTVSITTLQTHEGADLGLWTTSYPVGEASATASFSGGDLDGHNPSETHDPRLIEVD